MTKKNLQSYQDNGAHYNAPKIYQIKLKQGFQVNIKRMQRLIKKENVPP
ncbi:hypothetical protein bthur0009_56350 [Bacillus thuringiensis serovar andalousiensis BGSC 4AW1]|nr:hypothetical protein bthur0009_56350 [Bacillus thuringiensis serovar andalousiensis BGSC 4AW1]